MQLKKNCDGDDDDGDEHDGDDDEVLVIGEKSCYSPLDFPRRQMRSFNRIPIFLAEIYSLFSKTDQTQMERESEQRGDKLIGGDHFHFL